MEQFLVESRAGDGETLSITVVPRASRHSN
jgi:hypothetical protein